MRLKSIRNLLKTLKLLNFNKITVAIMIPMADVIANMIERDGYAKYELIEDLLSGQLGSFGLIGSRSISGVLCLENNCYQIKSDKY